MKKDARTLRVSIHLFAATAVLVPSLALAQSFAPWKAEVRVGDAALTVHDHDRARHVHRHPPHTAPSASTSSPLRRGYRTVYSGPQGGAFFLIRFFQIVISPQDGPNCRYNPTCSGYGRQAVEMHGGFVGGLLAGDRILRCNPYAPIGDDPVPPTLTDN